MLKPPYTQERTTELTKGKQKQDSALGAGIPLMFLNCTQSINVVYYITMQKSSCNNCGSRLEENLLKCKECGTWNIGKTKKEEEKIIWLNEAVSAENDRYIGGPWDPCFGGGIVKTGVTLLGGTPGAGKSTLLLQISDFLAEKYKVKILYLAAEEAISEIKSRAKRLELNNILKDKYVAMINAIEGETDLNELLPKVKPGLLIIDSLQGLVGPDDKAQIEICRRVKQYSIAYSCPTIVVNHVTKSGELAGLMTLQHDVDTIITFFPESDESDIRELNTPVKNRFGPAFVSVYFAMTEKGLILINENELEDSG